MRWVAPSGWCIVRIFHLTPTPKRRRWSARSTPMEPEMRKDDFEKLMAGAEDALAYAQGDKSRGVAHSVSTVDVAASSNKPDSGHAEIAEFGLEKSAKQKIS